MVLWLEAAEEKPVADPESEEKNGEEMKEESAPAPRRGEQKAL